MGIHVQEFKETKDEIQVILLITKEHYTQLTALAKRKKIKLSALIANALKYLVIRIQEKR